MALGTDQGGSIRLPAAWCGVYGMKPTYGLVPYTGAMSLEPTVDHIGPLGRTVDDCALLLEVRTQQISESDIRRCRTQFFFPDPS